MKKRLVIVSGISLVLFVGMIVILLDSQANRSETTEEQSQRLQHENIVRKLMTAEKGDLVLCKNNEINIVVRTAIDSNSDGTSSLIFFKGKRATIGEDGFIIGYHARNVREVIKKDNIHYVDFLKKYAVQ